MILVSIHDKKARAFYKPFTSATIETAQRELAASAASPDSPLFTHPFDYDAVMVGMFDPTNGSILGCDHAIISIPREVK